MNTRHLITTPRASTLPTAERVAKYLNTLPSHTPIAASWAHAMSDPRAVVLPEILATLADTP